MLYKLKYIRRPLGWQSQQIKYEMYTLSCSHSTDKKIREWRESLQHYIKHNKCVYSDYSPHGLVMLCVFCCSLPITLHLPILTCLQNNHFCLQQLNTSFGETFGSHGLEYNTLLTLLFDNPQCQVLNDKTKTNSISLMLLLSPCHKQFYSNMLIFS